MDRDRQSIFLLLEISSFHSYVDGLADFFSVYYILSMKVLQKHNMVAFSQWSPCVKCFDINWQFYLTRQSFLLYLQNQNDIKSITALLHL